MASERRICSKLVFYPEHSIASLHRNTIVLRSTIPFEAGFGLSLAAIATTLFEAIDPAEILIGSLLVATGFVIGVYAAFFLRGLLGRHLTNQREKRLTISEVFINDFSPDEWDPSHISPRPKTTELASQEEHVLRLLVANEGRMRQSALIGETGWSQAKVSRLLQEMETNGDISRIHIGRHNLVILGRFPPLTES